MYLKRTKHRLVQSDFGANSLSMLTKTKSEAQHHFRYRCSSQKSAGRTLEQVSSITKEVVCWIRAHGRSDGTLAFKWFRFRTPWNSTCERQQTRALEKQYRNRRPCVSCQLACRMLTFCAVHTECKVHRHHRKRQTGFGYSRWSTPSRVPLKRVGSSRCVLLLKLFPPSALRTDHAAQKRYQTPLPLPRQQTHFSQS